MGKTKIPAGTLGERIRWLRHQRGLTLDALATRIDSYKGALSQVENDHAEPRLDTLRRIAKALEVEVSELLS